MQLQQLPHQIAPAGIARVLCPTPDGLAALQMAQGVQASEQQVRVIQEIIVIAQEEVDAGLDRRLDGDACTGAHGFDQCFRHHRS